MLTAPTNWSEWWQDPESKLLLYITIIFGVGSYTSSATYSNEHLRDCMLEGSIASDVTLGNVTSKRLSFTLVNPGLPMSMFPRGEKITFKVALSKGGSTTSQVNQGTYFIDDAIAVNDVDIRVTAYDGMYFMTGVSFAEKSADTTLATYITQLPSKYSPTYTNLLNTTVKDRDGNDRTVGSIVIPKAATGIECQKVLASVATIAGGNIGIDKSNDFVLYRYGEYISKKTSVSHSSDKDVSASSISITNYTRISPGVTVDGAQSGYGTMIQGTLERAFTEDDTLFSGYLQDAAREVAHTFVNAASISTQGALVSPLIEAGDSVFVRTGNSTWSKFPVYDYHLNYNNGCWGSVGMNMSDDALPLMVDGATWKIARLGRYDTSATTTITQVSITGTHTFTITFGVRTPTATYPATRDYAIVWRVAAGANSIGRLSNVTLSYSVRGVRTSQTVTGYLLNQYSGNVQYYDDRWNGSVTYEYYTPSYFPVDDIVGQVIAGIVLKESGSTEEGITAIIQYARDGIFIPKSDNYVLEPDWSYPLPVENGGTGASSLSGAWTAMGGGDIGKKDTLAIGDIPGLPASKITSGTFAADRIPTATTSANGAITAAEKKKLNAISIGTQSNFQQNADTNGKRWRLRLSNADPANLAADVSTDGGSTWSSSAATGSVYFSKTGHTHAAGDITSETLPIARGGTGKTNAAAAWTALGGGTLGKKDSVSISTSDWTDETSSTISNWAAASYKEVDIAATSPSGYYFGGITKVITDHSSALHVTGWRYTSGHLYVRLYNISSSAISSTTVTVSVRFFKVTVS